MSRRAVETYFDQDLGLWTNRMEGGPAVGAAFPDKIQAMSRGSDLATYLGVRQVVLPAPAPLLSDARPVCLTSD